ncbi:MAG: HAMP domain-containing sensor histidine kinase [Acidobacteriota bacterium]
MADRRSHGANAVRAPGFAGTRAWPGQPWWWVFGLLIAAPALILAALGLRAVRAERIEREQQLRERQAQVARLADAALGNALARVESELRLVRAPAETVLDLPVLWLDRRGILAFPADKVYFGEFGRRPATLVSAAWSPATAALVAEAQAAEAQQRSGDAIALYRRIGSAEPRLRPWAEVSVARVGLRSGESAARAVLAEARWVRSQALTPSGLPVALLACASVRELPPEHQAAFAPVLERTLESLRAGQWWLSYEERRFHDEELRREMARAGVSLPEDARLEELAAIERAVRRSPPSRRGQVTRGYEREEQRGLLVLWSPSGDDAWVGVAVPQPRLVALIEAALKPVLGGQPFGGAVRDGLGHVLWTALPVNAQLGGTHELRSVSGWEISFDAPPDRGWTDQQRLLWYGFIALLVMMLMAGLAMTARVVRRELELGRLQSEFLAGVSHEFKSPLAAIRLLLERIAGGRLRAPEAAGEYCAAIGRETERLERLVNRILEAQQIQAGRREYSFALTSIIEVARSVIEGLRPRAEAKGVALELTTEDRVPELELDPAAIGDALENLVDNAIKYSPSGARVAVSVGAERGQVRVEVCDQGIGIEPADLPHIFDKFYRGRRGAEQSVHGTGLGLALVKAAVEAHGGTIEAASAPGQGSRFTVRLPVPAASGAGLPKTGEEPWPGS